MIYLHYKDTKTFGHSFSFLLIFKTLRASYLQVGNFSKIKTYNTLYIILCSYIVSRSLAHVQSERGATRYAGNVRTIGGQHTGCRLES